MVAPVIDIREKKLLVLGGAPRAGKSQLSKDLWQINFIPGFSMDAVVASFIRLAPEANINWGNSTDRAAKVTIVASLIVTSAFHNYDQFLIEGESVTPAVVDVMRDEFSLNACFMVLRAPRLDDLIRYETSNEWVGRLSPEDQRRTVCNITERSEWLVSECNRFGFPWVDMSTGDYRDRQRDAVRHLGIDQIGVNEAFVTRNRNYV